MLPRAIRHSASTSCQPPLPTLASWSQHWNCTMASTTGASSCKSQKQARATCFGKRQRETRVRRCPAFSTPETAHVSRKQRTYLDAALDGDIADADLVEVVGPRNETTFFINERADVHSRQQGVCSHDGRT